MLYKQRELLQTRTSLQRVTRPEHISSSVVSLPLFVLVTARLPLRPCFVYRTDLTSLSSVLSSHFNTIRHHNIFSLAKHLSLSSPALSDVHFTRTQFTSGTLANHISVFSVRSKGFSCDISASNSSYSHISSSLLQKSSHRSSSTLTSSDLLHPTLICLPTLPIQYPKHSYAPYQAYHYQNAY